MRDEFLEKPVSWEWRRLLETAKEDGKSFIPVSGVSRFELADWSGKLHRTTAHLIFLTSLVFLSFCLSCYNRCDFIVWTPQSLSVECIMFEAVILKGVKNLEFFAHWMLPERLLRDIQRGKFRRKTTDIYGLFHNCF